MTDGIRVSVEARYLPDRSDPDEDLYAFAYVVTIENQGDGRVQLKRRHWIITDGNGEVREVEGPGVVGEQPVLGRGDVHRYTSGAILKTPVGTMDVRDAHRRRARVPGGDPVLRAADAGRLAVR